MQAYRIAQLCYISIIIITLLCYYKIQYTTLHNTNNLQIITTCQEKLGFRLPSELTASQTSKSESMTFRV